MSIFHACHRITTVLQKLAIGGLHRDMWITTIETRAQNKLTHKKTVKRNKFTCLNNKVTLDGASKRKHH